MFPYTMMSFAQSLLISFKMSVLEKKSLHISSVCPMTDIQVLHTIVPCSWSFLERIYLGDHKTFENEIDLNNAILCKTPLRWSAYSRRNKEKNHEVLKFMKPDMQAHAIATTSIIENKFVKCTLRNIKNSEYLIGSVVSSKFKDRTKVFIITRLILFLSVAFNFQLQ